MKALRIWMICVGVFYLLNLLLLWPSIWAPQLPGMYPEVNLYQGEPVFQLVLDAWLIVGLGLAAIGVVLLVGSRQPLRYYAALIPVVLLTETLFSAWDIYSAMGYQEVTIAMITMVIHIIIIATGFWVWGKAKALDPALR
ncbi:MAG: BphX family protein [Porticoccaceae bacterium]|nr:BphX family protein [Porticoccaceae bacterium]